MRFGAQLYTVREFTQTHKDFAETIKKIAAIGYDCIQVSAINPEIPAQEVAETCQAYNLDIIISHVSPLKIIEETGQVIEDHLAMKAKYIGVGSLPNGYSHDKKGYRKFITDFIPAARAFKDAGFQLMYHNHHYEWEKFESKRAIEYLFEKFPEANFTLDTYWIQAAGGDPAYWIDKFKGRVDVIHLKDYAVVGGKRRMAEVMDGNLNWGAIFKASANAGVKFGMVEQDECYGKDPFECLRASLLNLKNGYNDLKHSK